ncbi:MAG: NAD(P)H-dependent oxidoreductase [Candidatus Brocadiae bacterium]|nr:NAD(P)H-dependent oxidoreductase [Candidatus Brocadiia bacterium]
MPPTRVLAVCGATSRGSRTRRLLAIAAESARAAGAEIRTLDLREVILPLYISDDDALDSHPAVVKAREEASWADGFLIGTPEYHGTQSGALKNWFDFLYAELSGKVAGMLAQTGGGGGDMSIMSAKASFAWCHGFTLPFHAAATGRDWKDDALTNDRVRDRLVRLGRDVVRYAPVIRAAWQDALTLGKGPEAGFAGFHVE